MLPWLGDGSALLLGAYSFSDEQHRFNSAFAIYPDGAVPAPYCKQILIPFGEYMPGASVFPVAQPDEQESRSLQRRDRNQGFPVSDAARRRRRRHDEGGTADLL